MIYFDATATTPVRSEVVDTYLKVTNKYWYNPSSAYLGGVEASTIFEDAGKRIKEVLNLANHEVLFTSGATEANNLAIHGICNPYLGKGMRVITTKIEHPSVYEVFKRLETLGFDVVYLDVDASGVVDLDQLKATLTKDTILVSIMWVNNIMGAIQPLDEIIKVVKQNPRTLLMVDAVQGVGKLAFDKAFQAVDLITVSAHKIEGLKGSGLLLYKKGINLTPHTIGATQQKGLRPGTIDLAGAAALTKALVLATSEQAEHYQYVLELSNYLKNCLKKIKEIYINSPVDASPYILNISIKNWNSETVMHFLEKRGIYVSVGSACNAKIKKPDRVIYELTKDEERASTTLRISLSHHNTKPEIDELIKGIKDLLGGAR